MYQISKRPWETSIGKSLVLLDVTFVPQNKKKRGKVLSHLVTSAVIQNPATSKPHIFKAVIDSGSPFNLISQMKVQEMQLLGGFQPKQKPRGIDGNLLHTYLEHKLETITTDFVGRMVGSTGVFSGVDIRGFDVILG